jgi:hypothetical protein
MYSEINIYWEVKPHTDPRSGFVYQQILFRLPSSYIHTFYGQFHQHANSSYKSLFGSFFYLHVTREKLPKRHLYKKFVRKRLMKLTPSFCLTKWTCCYSICDFNFSMLFGFYWINFKNEASCINYLNLSCLCKTGVLNSFTDALMI